MTHLSGTFLGELLSLFELLRVGDLSDHTAKVATSELLGFDRLLVARHYVRKVLLVRIFRHLVDKHGCPDHGVMVVLESVRL